MQKIVTLRCAGCGATYDFMVGANEKLASWREIEARIPEKKEAEKLGAMLAKMAETHTKVAMKEVCRNSAEVLNNISYENCGEDTTPLLREVPPELTAVAFNEKVNEGVVSSAAKWKAASEREGLEAYEAIYLCPKSHRPKQGLHCVLRARDNKGVRVVYAHKNACDDCSATLTLVNDGNLGFMHEECATAARCKCGGALTVDKVSFKMPQKEQEGSAQ